jgi:hypothetical protein
MKDETKDVRQIVNRIVELKDALEAVKPFYDEIDELTQELQEIVGVNHNLFADDGRVVSVVDNFSEKNTVFRPVGVKRFDAKVETMEEMQKSQERQAKKAAKALRGA